MSGTMLYYFLGISSGDRIIWSGFMTRAHSESHINLLVCVSP